MTCEESLNLISAKLDRELAADDQLRLDAHLAECAACRASADALETQDAELTRAFAPHRRSAAVVADRVISQLRAQERPARRIFWLPMLASAAAGFVVAFALFHRSLPTPTNEQARLPASQPSMQPVTPATKPAVAQLALATGAVQFRCPGDAAWCSMPTGGNVEADTRVRTAPGVRCEFKTVDGSEIRLNGGTEVQLKSPRRFELASGQVWSSVARGTQPFEAFASDATFTALGTQFDLVCKPQQAVLTVVEGSVRVKGGGGEDVVTGGQQVAVLGGRLGDKQQVYNLVLATRWVNEILVMKGRDNPELSHRIDDLFAGIGEAKMSSMFEDEIRSLGDHCVIPLTRFIESDRSNGQVTKRATAAKIIADVAPQWAIPELIELLEDQQGEVRYYAATALRRLTGRDEGRAPEQWRADAWGACVPSMNAWKQWWQTNRERYPGVPPEATVVKERSPMKKG